MPFDLSETMLLQTEDKLGTRLPAFYREAMLRENGGDIEVDGDSWFLYPLRDVSTRKRLSRTVNHVIAETEQLLRLGNFPRNGLAIAENGSGDQMLFLKMDGCFSNDLYHWRHETGELEKIAADHAQWARTSGKS